MIVYHGSDSVVKNPDITFSTRCLDFGCGFYITSVKEQAIRWAKRKAIINEKSSGYLNIYELNYTGMNFNICDFEDNLDNWLDFVCKCRDGSDDYKAYDIIKGKVTDDKVFRVVDMYKRGIWDKDRAIKEMRVYETYNQTAFISQIALNESLTFIDAVEVSL